MTDLREGFLEISLEFESALLKISASGQQSLTTYTVLCGPLFHFSLSGVSVREEEVLPSVREVAREKLRPTEESLGHSLPEKPRQESATETVLGLDPFFLLVHFFHQ